MPRKRKLPPGIRQRGAAYHSDFYASGRRVRERLSTDLTSLNPGEDRLAVVVEMIVAEDGTVRTSDVYRARIRNQAQLTLLLAELREQG